MVLGTTPDGGLTQILPELIGEKRALDVLLFNRSVDSVQALQWGLVSQGTQPGALESKASELATRLAAGPSAATIQLKQLIKRCDLDQFSDHLDRELRSFLGCASTPAFEEGVRAFLEKRNPVFDH